MEKEEKVRGTLQCVGFGVKIPYKLWRERSRSEVLGGEGTRAGVQSIDN